MTWDLIMGEFRGQRPMQPLPFILVVGRGQLFPCHYQLNGMRLLSVESRVPSIFWTLPNQCIHLLVLNRDTLVRLRA